jgi:murein DD-endopeptidase MepM/ murein hydrolase activator NlpD
MIRWITVFVLVMGILQLPALLTAQDASTDLTIHVVQRGETLFRIALRYGTTVEVLARLNGIVDPTNIQVGQRLLVPFNALTASDSHKTHVVQAGETLRSIADLYGITVNEIARLNNIADSDQVYVGQILTLVPQNSESMSSSQPPPISPTNIPPDSNDNQFGLVYIVQAGDTLFRIARQYGVEVADLTQANRITDPTLIYPGQQLIVPGVEPPQLALDLPEGISRIDVVPLILVEGQTGEFRVTTTIPSNLAGSFLGRPLNIAADQGNTIHTMLVGVPVFTEAGVYPLDLSVTVGDTTQTQLTVNIQVVAGNYGRETISLLAGRVDLLDPDVESFEQSLIQSVMSKFTPVRYFEGSMSLPAAASVTSPFGRKRSYNGGPFDHFHSGTDFSGAPGTPIMASATGVVVFVDTLNVRGKATIIDHGWGVFTGYWHQSEQYAQIGDVVSTGQVIGTVGATGRVTGPHLHWEMWVNGIPVDPMQWIKQSFS